MKFASEKARRSNRKHLDIEWDQLNYLSQWWNQRYTHQKHLESCVEHPLFHLLISILVVSECASVITEILLYNAKRLYECNVPPYSPKDYIHKKAHNLEHGIEICHYISLSILSLFIFELLVKIYALGSHYWNWKENRKLDYFDAFLVVFSFTIKMSFLLIDKESIMAHSVILIIILRLWHLLRVANGIARCFHKEEESTIVVRRRSYFKSQLKPLVIPSSIQTLLNLMQEKTECLRRDISIEQVIIARFEDIDKKCQHAFDKYYGDETKLVEEIQSLHVIVRRTRKKKLLQFLLDYNI